MEWKDVKGYEGLYQVNDVGQVRSLSHLAKNNINGGMRITEGRVLKPYKMPSGYMQVQLSKNSKRTKAYIHRLVAEAFLENSDCLSDVNHIDGNKKNNVVNNLEWVSHKDNQVHMVKNRMTKKAFPVVCVETMATYNSLSEAEKATGADRHGIKTSCETGKIYKGVHWRYANE